MGTAVIRYGWFSCTNYHNDHCSECAGMQLWFGGGGGGVHECSRLSVVGPISKVKVDTSSDIKRQNHRGTELRAVNYNFGTIEVLTCM